MHEYLRIVDKVLKRGTRKQSRTGIDVLSITGELFEHDMGQGFPLLTTKSMPFSIIAAELEFFIRGITDKNWLQARGCHVWDDWCNPRKVPYVDLDPSSRDLVARISGNQNIGNDDIMQCMDVLARQPELINQHSISPKQYSQLQRVSDNRRAMFQERDLGPIYGFQWRHFGAEYAGCDADYSGQGVDQLANLVRTLMKNPNDRRMIVSAWNPADIDQMALPACHYGFQVTVADGKLNLLWNQRSVDTALGLPFNIASYGLLLHLLAKESGLKEGKLVGSLTDVHIYANQLTGIKEQIDRKPFELPKIETPDFRSVFNWEYTDSEVLSYKHHQRIKIPLAV
jgi:thymidylate synthase